MQHSIWKVQQLADHWDVSRKVIYQMIADGRLHAIKAGKEYLITDESVEALFARAAA